MQINVEDLNSLTKKITILLPEEYVAERLNSAYNDLKATVSLKGFRKGKIPRKILEKNYGDKVKDELAEKIIKDTYFDALEKENIDAVVHPEIKSQNFKEDGTFTYEAEVDVSPVFELGKYKGVEIEQDKIIITDTEVEKELEEMRQELAPLRSVKDRPVQENDIVVIDFTGYQNGKQLKQVVGEDYSVNVGSGRNGKEFEEQLIGLHKGVETSREIEFPVSFSNPILADKTIEFKINVKEIKERVLADLDDEFAKDINDKLTTLDELKADIRNNQHKKRKAAQQGDLTDKVMLKLLEAHDFGVPRRLVAHEINTLITELKNNLETQGMTLESAGMSHEALAEQYQDAAEKRVKGDFILKKIAETEKIKLDNDNIEQGFKRVAARYNMPVSEAKKYFQNRDDLLPFINELLNEKILKFVKDHAEITTTGENA